MAEALKEEGNKLMAENKPIEAIAKYTEAINVAGTSHLLLSNRSAAYAKAGKWKEALEDADSCLSLNEKFDKGYARKAGALMGMGNNKEAMKVCQAGLSMCPESEILKKKWKELEQPPISSHQTQHRAPSSSPSSSGVSVPQRVFVFLAPVTFAYLMYSIFMSVSAGNTNDLREILLVMAFHMLVGLFAKHGVVSIQTLKTLYQRIRVPPTEFCPVVAQMVKMQHETWLHYIMFAIILSNATPMFSGIFIVATVAIMSTHVLLFAVAKRYSSIDVWLQKIQQLVEKQVPYLEVAISLGLIADICTPYRSLFATVMYFWVFQRQRLTPIPMHVFSPRLYNKPCFAPSGTRQAWSKLDDMVAPFFKSLPLLNGVYPKIVELASKFADPQGVAGRQ